MSGRSGHLGVRGLCLVAVLCFFGCSGNEGAETSQAWVRAIRADELVQSPGNLFDLEGRGLRFTPKDDLGYTVTRLEQSAFETVEGEPAPLEVALPFAFPFRGKEWTTLRVFGEKGYLSFGCEKPEYDCAVPGAPWPQGSVRDVAGEFLRRVAETQEHIIVGLWGDYGPQQVTEHRAADHVTFTWHAQRVQLSASDFGPLGECAFQVALYANGVVELRYEKVAERDSVVGMFAGANMTEADLSAAGAFRGGAFEVFEYPALVETPKILQRIYEQVRPEDDFAVLFTDFRLNRVYGSAAASGPINLPILGLGGPELVPRPGDLYGSGRLQNAVDPVWVLQWPFAESMADGEHSFEHYAYAVSLMAHELTHRWGVYLNAADSSNNERLSFTEPDECNCHWDLGLHAPSVYPVGSRYSKVPYPEHSVMGGAFIEDRGNGLFDWKPGPYRMPGGFSALDLYLMGVVPADEVPDTFLFQAQSVREDGLYVGYRFPVRIADIIDVYGVREPSAAKSQRTFSMGVYLLHRGPAPDPEAVRRAEGIAKEIATFFELATHSQIHIVPSQNAR